MGQEVQPNRPLSGKEYIEIILSDIRRVLEQDSMLASHIAYSQVGHSITVKIMTNNPIIPNWSNVSRSQKSTPQQIEDSGELAAIESFPIPRTEDDEPIDFGEELTRQIISPNMSRIENGLGVPINIRGIDGDIKEEKAVYDPESITEHPELADVVTQRELTPGEITRPE
jgi:hypothetical protein